MFLVFLHFQDGFGNDLESICDGFTFGWRWDPTGVSHPTLGVMVGNPSSVFFSTSGSRISTSGDRRALNFGGVAESVRFF